MSLSGLPLAFASTGELVEVSSIAGGRAMQKRLGDLGVRVGRTLQVVQKDGGPMVVAVGETRFALGQGMAEKILVTPGKQKETARDECEAEGACCRRARRRGWFR